MFNKIFELLWIKANLAGKNRFINEISFKILLFNKWKANSIVTLEKYNFYKILFILSALISPTENKTLSKVLLYKKFKTIKEVFKVKLL